MGWRGGGEGKEGEKEREGEGDGVVLCFGCVVLLGWCRFVLVLCGVARETVKDFSPVTLIAHLRAPLGGGVPAAPPYPGVPRVMSVLVCLAWGGVCFVMCGVAKETVKDFSPVTLIVHLRGPLGGGAPAAPPYLGVARASICLVFLVSSVGCVGCVESAWCMCCAEVEAGGVEGEEEEEEEGEEGEEGEGGGGDEEGEEEEGEEEEEGGEVAFDRSGRERVGVGAVGAQGWRGEIGREGGGGGGGGVVVCHGSGAGVSSSSV